MNLNKVIVMPEKVKNKLNSLINDRGYTLINDKNTYYIIASAGATRTGGYSINISSANIMKKTDKVILEVNTSYIKPHSKSILTQVISYPYDIKSFIYDGKITDLTVIEKLSTGEKQIYKYAIN